MRAHVREALQDAGLSHSDLVPVRLTRYQAVLERVLETFTTFGVRGENRLWLWEGFKGSRVSTPVEDGPSVMAQLLAPHDLVWLLLEDWEGTKKRGNYWVFEGEVQSVTAVLKHLFHVEYYVVDREFAWLLCENHHGVMTAVGRTMPERLQAWVASPYSPAPLKPPAQGC
ncbi:hypothetical protein GCM10008955_17520 [Deinococcus malanensis]|uniref:Uncharacterized protein n=1 Tax=Deinococcus malanensis TaxID=1706855 RepID=A0ABQ2ESK6_9DEIO|nr:DUF6756 family protein [Deinococcus malanensis]GGK24425.1 hypothetical protein GCM10008955_17520 [Deinococcus malanensis]